MQRQIDAVLKRINPKIHYKKKSTLMQKNSNFKSRFWPGIGSSFQQADLLELGLPDLHDRLIQITQMLTRLTILFWD